MLVGDSDLVYLQQRNKMIFSNETFDSNKLIDEAAFLLWTWLRHLEKDFSLHFYFCSAKIYYIIRIVLVVLKIHRDRCESSFPRVMIERELETQYYVTKVQPHLPSPNT